MSDNIYMWKHKKRVNHLTLYQRWGALIRFLTSPACSFVQRSKVSNNGNSTDAIHAYTCNTSCIDSCQILTCKISRPQSMYGLCVRVKPFCGVIESMLCSVYWRYTNLNQTWKSQDFKNEYSFHRHLLESWKGVKDSCRPTPASSWLFLIIISKPSPFLSTSGRPPTQQKLPPIRFSCRFLSSLAPLNCKQESDLFLLLF